MTMLKRNTAAVLVALVVVALVVVALAGVDVPVLSDVLLLLVGGAVGAQVPKRARA